MNFLTRAAINRLNDDGYLVISPADPRPLPIYDDVSALSYVRALGYTAIRTKIPPNPPVGACWMPSRGKSRYGVPPKLEARWVRSVGLTEMSYALTRDGVGITINLTTWHRWRQKTRARVVR